MNDSSLEKLSIKPGKLEPKFTKDCLLYNVTVGSNIDHIDFDGLTSDSGASWCIYKNNGKRTVNLIEGKLNEIKVEVTAEDGKTIKYYCVNIRRLSAKDTMLSNLKCSIGYMEPKFAPEINEYFCYVSCGAHEMTVTPSVGDNNMKITVNDSQPGSPIRLNVGQTLITLQVKSSDKSNTGLYSLYVIRNQLPRHIILSDENQQSLFEDPISLSLIYRPITIRNSKPKHTFSAGIIDRITKRNKIDPLNGEHLALDWRTEDYEMDKNISNSIGKIPLSDGTISEALTVSELAKNGEKFNIKMTLSVPPVKYLDKMALNHKITDKKWEKSLQQIFDQTDASKLIKDGEDCLKRYFDLLQSINEDNDSILENLQNSIHCYATAIQFKLKDDAIHTKLAQLLEEKYYLEDVLGVCKTNKKTLAASKDANVEAKESSKEEECDAICQLRNVPKSASLGDKLKAIDAEYRQLINSNQTGKADHVQGLYAWKSKQGTKEGRLAQMASDDMTCLGQAKIKYFDALSLNDGKAMTHFNVGRMLLVEGNYEEAIKRFELALSFNANMDLAKYYLGSAIVLSTNKKDPDRIQEAAVYLLTALEALQAKLTLESFQNTYTPRKTLQSENLLRPDNITLLRAFNRLAKTDYLKSQTVLKCLSPDNLSHNVLLLASQALVTTNVKGSTFQQLEWVLIDGHAKLFDSLIEKKADSSVVAERCRRINAIIQMASIPKCKELVDVQLKTIQKLVYLQPSASHSLYLLGDAQMLDYELNNNSNEEVLNNAIKSFKASIALEGKPIGGEAPAELLEQDWYKNYKNDDKPKEVKEQPKKSLNTSSNQQICTKGKSDTKTTATAPKAKGPPPKVATTKTPLKPQAKVVAPAKNQPKVTPQSTKKPQPVPQSQETKPSQSSENVVVVDNKSQTPASAKTNKPTIINGKSPLSRLGLARGLRQKKQYDDSKTYYYQVIDMQPNLHDAYIECGEMLVEQNRSLEAVDVYSKLQIEGELSFDDSFIFGEIVRLMMKNEMYDDIRLEKNLIKMGKVLGIAAIENYVKKLEDKFKNQVLCNVYAGVHGKSVDDEELVAFFKFKCWK